MQWRWFPIVLLRTLLVVSVCGAAVGHLRRRSSAPPQIIVTPMSNATFPTQLKVLPNTNHHDAYLITSSEAFTIQSPTKHPSLEKTSRQARRHHCHAATNGGPFSAHGDMVGVVVQGGIVVSHVFGGAVGFGRTRNHEWVLGSLQNVRQVERLDIVEFVTGFDWLVHDGQPVNASTTDTLRAPRTAIGVNSEGQLMLLVVDGCEKCLFHEGLTLRELAELFVSVGVRHAMNLDGGGSTTLVVGGKVRNRPTCWDVPILCERSVATIVCLSSSEQTE